MIPRPDWYDLIALFGLCSMAYGLYIIAPELAYIVIGIAMLCLGLLGARWKAKGK